ncbi:MAG: Uma2 family endonuclease [Rhodocyclaceae bacterium]|nr:Uma2 family endonuclease [Rhodocyclaceae bacterium]
MGVALRKIDWVSVADYLAEEEKSQERHEYLGGEVYAMSGASARHNVISGNLFAALRTHLAGGPCRTFIHDVKVHLATASDDYFYYPDVMVACRPEDNASHWRDSPCVLVEVISPTTERIDRREKLLAYREIAALEEYVVIAQDRHEVLVYRRTRQWRVERFTPPDELILPCLNFHLPVEMLYEGTEDL